MQTNHLGKFKMENLLMKVLSKVVGPSVLLDENFHIIEIINDMSPYLKAQPGRFSSNIFSNLPTELSLFVNNILRRLKGGDEEVVFERIKHIESYENWTLRLTGKLIEVQKAKYFLVCFDQETVTDSLLVQESHLVMDLEHEINERVKQLEHELLVTKDSFQAIVEELETSNEELQSSNEELIASNEELQSTNEELKSDNEELYSVNSEYQKKIDNLIQLNDDVSNLFDNTEIGALYLDHKLCIRRINKKVCEITNILETDVGRPIAHIAVMEQYPEFISDISKVVETLRGMDKEYLDYKKRTWQTRIRPYRSECHAVDGVIITFIEITNLKEKEHKLTQLNTRLDLAMEFGNIAWWEWDLTTNKVLYDPKKATMIGYTVEEFPDLFQDICALIHPEDYETTMKLMRDYLGGQTESWIATYRIRRQNGTYAWYYNRGKITQRNSQGEGVLMVGTVIDISNIKALEMAFGHIGAGTSL